MILENLEISRVHVDNHDKLLSSPQCIRANMYENNFIFSPANSDLSIAESAKEDSTI